MLAKLVKDEALYDAITVCALFKFYNTWIDATGVRDMPAFAYEMSGKRLATVGYTPKTQRPSQEQQLAALDATVDLN